MALSFVSRTMAAFGLLALFLPTGRLFAQQSPAQPSEGPQIAADTEGIEFFEKKVRPLLAARCQGCHGAEKQKGNLRLDSRASVLKGGDTAPAVVPGKPDESLLVDAIRYGETYQMPPKSQLPQDEIATLVEWVRRGAPWGHDAPAITASVPGSFDLAARAGHWSFRPLAPPALPDVADSNWVRTPVDQFILAGLEAAGLKPAAAADRLALLRRVTFDLTGLPPTVAQIESFLADESPGAYERVVERLLASPRYAERWARHWLDLVRYAETHGHEFDFEIPNTYRYRDYVIRALDADLPFDQFVVEHVAGDLVQPPRRHPLDRTNESIVATGWYFFGEAKHSPVDVRQDEADRIDNQIDVFGKAFLGLTISCARCHDHKFDPISTKDYYALAGYLQSSRYQQAFLDSPDDARESTAQLKAVADDRRQACVEFARSALVPSTAQLAAALLAPNENPSGTAWSKYMSEPARGEPDDPFYAWTSLIARQSEAAPLQFSDRRAQWLARATKQAADARAANATLLASFEGPDFGDWIATGSAFGSRPARPLEWAFVDAARRPDGMLIEAPAAHSGMLSPRLRGVLRSPTFEITQPSIWYRVYGNGGRVRLILDGLQLIQNPIYGGLNFAPAGHEPRWHEQDVSKWIGHRAYIELVDDGDGYVALERVAMSEAGPPPAQPNSLVLAALDDPALTSPPLLAEKLQSLFAKVLSDWLADPSAANLATIERGQIIGCMLEQPSLASASFDAAHTALRGRLSSLDARQQQIEARLASPRQAPAIADGTGENERVFIRGSHKTLGEEVPRRFLEVLGGADQPPPAAGSGRFQLARQLVSPSNPLLPRVMVNRVWLHHFGEGLVRSSDDFGAMGQLPTHPQLLDFLAAEFIRSGWSLKQLHRMLVLSNTYRMSSAPVDADSADPQNKLWHRMNVRRLEAEAIRDSLLAVSGRIVTTQYGPGVMPYLTEHMTGRGRPTSSGPLDGDGRRSIYLAVRRNFLPPMFLAFDYPTPFTTISRRSTSNVPAQALSMMNNPLVIQQARIWAERVLSQGDQAPSEQVRQMYLSALGRPPDEAELRAAVEFLGPAASGGPGALDAWSDLAHVLFNVKEFIFIR